MRALTLILAVVMLPLALPAQQQTNQPNQAIQASESYAIGPLDLLRFRVVGEEETNTEVRVSNDGKVNLPYIGPVKIADMTVAEAREQVYALYNADFYVDPQIDMAVIGYRQRRVNVQGMVNNQGFVNFPPEEEMTLLGAISAAGGWRTDRLSDKGNVELTRTTPDGSTQTHKIDATSISPNDWLLKDGDYIYVNERRW
jgi:polysaccharide export outer membrane protein